MADGSQRAFPFPRTPSSRLRPGEIVVDLFAGGGGASTALEQALGRPVDIAINHNPWAVSMHAANHPLTTHLCQDVWEADPRIECAGKAVGWLHASPDCTHFSQAKGGQPRSRATRSLSWVVLRWAGTVHPRIISLENVKEILKWGPLVAKRDKATGRVFKLDGTLAAPRERVAIDQQFLIPDKRHAGRTWKNFLRALHRIGYVVEWRRLKACDYGAGTSRERLFLCARRDGEPIRWPAPTHGRAAGQQKPVTAADSIDFGDLGRSIFDRPRPLAEATMRRIAKGLAKHVLEAAEPFFLTEFANAGNGGRTWSGDEPLRTQCAGVKGGHFAMVAPTLVKFKGDSVGHPVTDQVPTITAGGDCKRPAGAAHSLGIASAFLTAMAQNVVGIDMRDPLPTILAGATRFGLITTDLARLSPEHHAGALRVAAFLISYYGNGDALSVCDPLDTITTRDRLALVTVHVRGVPYVIVDIGLRMLKPHELFAAQGFPRDYIIDRTADGRAVSVSRSVAMVGNSVSPPPLRAIAEANLDRATQAEALAA